MYCSVAYKSSGKLFDSIEKSRVKCQEEHHDYEVRYQ